MGKRSDSRRFGSLAYGHLNGFEATHDRGATGISPAYENVAILEDQQCAFLRWPEL